MLPNPNQIRISQEGGVLTISRRVVRHVIHRIAMDQPGIVQLGGDSIWKRLFRWLNLPQGPRGIELELADNEAAMTLTIVVRFGARVPQIAAELRRRLRSGLREQLGVEVRTVNIHVKSVKWGGLPLNPSHALHGAFPRDGAFVLESGVSLESDVSPEGASKGDGPAPTSEPEAPRASRRIDFDGDDFLGI